MYITSAKNQKLTSTDNYHGKLFNKGNSACVSLGTEFKFHWQRDPESITGIRNPLRGIQNRRLSWIPLHGVICRQDRTVKKATVTLMINLPSFTANT